MLYYTDHCTAIFIYILQFCYVNIGDGRGRKLGIYPLPQHYWNEIILEE
jgi:hypothetical protein